MTDSISVIRSPFLLLAKRIHADGKIQDYDNAKTIDLAETPVANLDDLRSVVAWLLPRPHCAAVFGAIADPARVHHVRRLAYADLETGDLPTLRAVPHRWVALDVDGTERPEHLAAADLPACATQAVRRLPTAFHGVRCIVQATAGHGIKPGCRLRLWYWLDRPTTGDELKQWLKAAPVDPCTFRTAQPIFTAAPVFIGRSDHLPTRLAELPGAPVVAVPAPELLKPPERPRPQQTTTSGTLSPERVQRIIDRALHRVRNAPDTGKHYALRDNARLLGGIAAQVGLSDADLLGQLLAALPAGVKDWNAAQKTAEWGLARGREEPIDIPPERGPDPRRSQTAKSAFRLLRAGICGNDIVRALYEQNASRAEPLPSDTIHETVRWAARQFMESAHAA